jgi:DNA-binding LacI/PurR family transcriptional regulator
MVYVPVRLEAVAYSMYLAVSFLAYFHPPLTTVHQDFEEVGRQCVALLVEQITTGLSVAGVVSSVPPRLVQRSSAGPPP